MKAEFIMEQLFSGKHDELTVGQFATILKGMDLDKLDRISEAEVEDEKYAKQVERANDIINERAMK